MLAAVNWVGVRNFLIIAAIAALGVVWRKGFDAIAISVNQVITVVFVAVLALFGYNYFRQNRLAWLVLRPWQRAVVIGSGVAILALVIGYPWAVERLTAAGFFALLAALVLLIVWVVRESRRLR
ncbi:MAG: hypothetical protein QOK40_2143 [Miltoncostaeaceae bacterium]|jgi:hypothetical protein|nr:hypothetical protein [Miltoncostaeaceae bacterium]